MLQGLPPRPLSPWTRCLLTLLSSGSSSARPAPAWVSTAHGRRSGLPLPRDLAAPPRRRRLPPPSHGAWARSSGRVAMAPSSGGGRRAVGDDCGKDERARARQFPESSVPHHGCRAGARTPFSRAA